MKKSIILIEVALIFMLLIGLNWYSDYAMDKNNRKELEAFSIEITENIYIGNENYFEDVATNLALHNINQTMTKTKGRHLETLSVNTYINNLKESSQIIVINRIYEKPFKNILFHKITFSQVDNKWLIYDFEVDS